MTANRKYNRHSQRIVSKWFENTKNNWNRAGGIPGASPPRPLEFCLSMCQRQSRVLQFSPKRSTSLADTSLALCGVLEKSESFERFSVGGRLSPHQHCLMADALSAMGFPLAQCEAALRASSGKPLGGKFVMDFICMLHSLICMNRPILILYLYLFKFEVERVQIRDDEEILFIP